MAQLSGRYLGPGFAKTASGKSVYYVLRAPDGSPGNLAFVASEVVRWRDTAAKWQTLALQGKMDPNVARRASFAVECLTVIAGNLKLGACCTLIAQDGCADRILGLSSYGFIAADAGSLNLQAIDPEHLAGTPGTDQLRGIGTALLAGVSREFLRHGATTMYLHPLDEAAGQFWMRRGFGVCGRGGLMCARSRESIEKLRDGCSVFGTLEEEQLLCGMERRANPLPAAR